MSEPTQRFVQPVVTANATKMALPVTGRKTASVVSMDGGGEVLAAVVSPPGWCCIFWLKTSDAHQAGHNVPGSAGACPK